MILQYTVVYMHISWFIHISHTTVRALRPKPLLKGLSSKASEKITHRLKVFSCAAGLSKATRLHHVPQAVSWTVVQLFPVKLATAWKHCFGPIELFQSFPIHLIHRTCDVPCKLCRYTPHRSQTFCVAGSEFRLSKRIYITGCNRREGFPRNYDFFKFGDMMELKVGRQSH